MSTRTIVGWLFAFTFALSACGDGGEAETVPGQPPAAPTGVRAAGGDGDVRLTWVPVQRASLYEVLRSSNSGGPYAVIGQATVAAFVDGEVRNGQTYFYVVRAVNRFGTSENSREVAATPSRAGVQQAPAPPINLQARAGDRRVMLSWNGVPNAIRYRVVVALQTGGPYGEVAEPTGTTFTHVGLKNGTTYYYRVTALNEGGSSGFSNEASATPTAGIPASPPAVPRDLTALPGDAQVSLSWSASVGASVYEVLSSTTSGGPYTTVAVVDETFLTQQGLTNGTTYYYVVRGRNEAGRSAASAEVSATPLAEAEDEVTGEAPLPPENVNATWTGEGVRVDWQAAEDATSYDILRAEAGDDEFELVATVEGSPYLDADVEVGKSYAYVVRAANEFGTSAPSDQAVATAPPGAMIF